MPVNFEEIKRRREKLGLTLNEAAQRAGFKGPNARTQWHDLETGKYQDPRISRLEAAARALGCKITLLLTTDPPA